MIVKLVRQAIILLNQFPALDGISKILSPKCTMTGKPNLDYNSLKIEFGSYMLVFEDNDPTNPTKSQSMGAIALNPTGNVKGDYHFMSLTMGKCLLWWQWTAIPMPNLVIAAVETWAKEEKQPLIKGGCPKFEWHPNVPFLDVLNSHPDPMAVWQM